jgi:hypothetical protein
VLAWNQAFLDTLIATNTANSLRQRLRAIIHTAIFDAHNDENGYQVVPVAMMGAPEDLLRCLPLATGGNVLRQLSEASGSAAKESM